MLIYIKCLSVKGQRPKIGACKSIFLQIVSRGTFQWFGSIFVHAPLQVARNSKKSLHEKPLTRVVFLILTERAYLRNFVAVSLAFHRRSFLFSRTAQVKFL